MNMSHIPNKLHPQCSTAGCLLSKVDYHVLVGCMYGNMHEIVCKLITDNDSIGLFFYDICKLTNAHEKDLAFILSDLQKLGTIQSTEDSVYNGVWKATNTIDISCLCISNERAALEFYKILTKRIERTGGRQAIGRKTGTVKVGQRRNLFSFVRRQKSMYSK